MAFDVTGWKAPSRIASQLMQRHELPQSKRRQMNQLILPLAATPLDVLLRDEPGTSLQIDMLPLRYQQFPDPT